MRCKRDSWRASQASLACFSTRPLVVAFTRPDGVFCQIQLLGLPTDGPGQDALAVLAGRLDRLARQWQAGEHVLRPAGPEVECHQVSVSRRQRAA